VPPVGDEALAGFDQPVRLDTEHVVPHAGGGPHPVVPRQLGADEHPQVDLVAKGGAPTLAFESHHLGAKSLDPEPLGSGSIHFMLRRFAQLDVFTERALSGNPLAVVIDSGGLDTDDMQRFAHWTNLSETTFLLPPTDPSADYRVRIFTPTEELPFAGHPTLGSAHAWLSHGGVPREAGHLVQQCGIGLVRIRLDGTALSFKAPPLLRGGSVHDSTVDAAAAGLGIARESIVDAAWVDNGPGWLGLLLGSAAEVRAVRARPVGLTVGIVGLCSADSPFAYEVRAFYSAGGISLEDPVTGSLNASIAQWLLDTGRVQAPYLVSQGSEVGRAGVVRVTTDSTGAVWIGGDIASCIEGTVDI